MTLAYALTIGVVFGAGAYLLLKPDLLRFVLGIVLISQSAVLTLIVSGRVTGRAPIHPLPEGPVSDPLPQALALTAIVIGLAVSALLLVLVARVYVEYHTTEPEQVAAADREEEPEPDPQEAARP